MAANNTGRPYLSFCLFESNVISVTAFCKKIKNNKKKKGQEHISMLNMKRLFQNIVMYYCKIMFISNIRTKKNVIFLT